MKNGIYIRKNEIPKKELIEYVVKLIEEKNSLERDFEEDFSFRYVLVSYLQENFYFDKETSLLFPIFNESVFKKYSLEGTTYETILSELRESFFNIAEWQLLNTMEYKKCFYQEKKMNIINNGKIISEEGELDSFICCDKSELICFDEKMEKKDCGYAIPVIRLDNMSRKLNDIIEFWEKNKIVPIFESEKQQKKYERLVYLYERLKEYNVVGKKVKIQNVDAVLKDLEEEKFIYPVDDYLLKLLNIEKGRIDVDEYDDKILTDMKRGHWDIFFDENEIDITRRDMVKVFTDKKVYGRDPKKDVKYSGAVAIDFGTKSTVVTCQKNNEKSYLVKVGGGSYKEYDDINKYENPTVMEFLDIDSFMEQYNNFKGRPFTRWEDLKISHTAVSNYKAGSTSVVEGLKQWCGHKKETFIIYDKKGKKIVLPPYIDITDENIDPIEIYAYYIGSYINNMHTQDIFLEYILSFPITYEKAIREKMLKSFEKGIKKSLPVSILEDKQLMEDFIVRNGTNEPTAYAICALNEFQLIPKKVEEKVYYGVFDFGGGTTDFTFGVCTKSQNKRYDYEIKHFGENGLKYLGGENILRVLAYNVFIYNLSKNIENNISIYCPIGCESNFVGSENVISNSYEARFNLTQLCEKLRLFWEEPEIFDKERTDRIKVTLLDNQGVRKEAVEFEYDEDELRNIIDKMILDGIENFLHSLKLMFKNNNLVNDMDKIHIFLAGNSSKNLQVQKLFNQKLFEYEKQINGENRDNKYFYLYLPLGSKDNITKQREDENKVLLNGKTGTAYGLLYTRLGSRVKIKAIDEMKNNSEVNFKYYVGYSLREKMKVILTYKTGYGNWVEFLDAGEEVSELYYSDKQIAIEQELSTDDISVKRKRIILDEVNDEANIYIRIKNPNTLEYVVAYKDEILNKKYLSDIKEIKLS